MPSELYEPTETLTTFLAGNPDAWFLADECVPYADCWREVGLRDEISIDRRKPDNRGYVVSASHHGMPPERSGPFDPALEMKVSNDVEQNLERSLIIWSLLSDLGVPLRGDRRTKHSTGLLQRNRRSERLVARRRAARDPSVATRPSEVAETR